MNRVTSPAAGSFGFSCAAVIDAKNANNKKDKAQEKVADKPGDPPATNCDVSEDAYDRLLKGMQAELEGRKKMGEDYAAAKAGSAKYQQCTGEYAGTEEYQKVLNKLPPSQNMSVEQMMKWMQDKTQGADSAMAKKCGKDPILSWDSSDHRRMLEEIAANAAKTAGMDDQRRPRYTATRISNIAVIGAVITMNSVISSSCTTGRCSSAEDTSMDAISTQPVPSVVPIVGGWIRS